LLGSISDIGEIYNR